MPLEILAIWHGGYRRDEELVVGWGALVVDESGGGKIKLDTEILEVEFLLVVELNCVELNVHYLLRRFSQGNIDRSDPFSIGREASDGGRRTMLTIDRNFKRPVEVANNNGTTIAVDDRVQLGISSD
ncbi:hypothetical protein NE237_019839 [Protea cynaroides]|uniref:Uncharacterized protein n=1 Tax=Protea cynaroides TaxID=273540 RepID=A0A9Q0K132_9MAGN|nr:hypothetical protein NE237_019839 [Protea cynaroides]